ncbi:hypothetical protein Goklo_007413 [Gossypium klotzschianum]|uniref:Uncharacterized protein n=1 Tax=Gossypium klotzschianum TaxID=34286 RepID=A0A7J8WCT2_9ROSI|nr:hypothetical protein [Gossypium klotzschianum]
MLIRLVILFLKLLLNDF